MKNPALKGALAMALAFVVVIACVAAQMQPSKRLRADHLTVTGTSQTESFSGTSTSLWFMAPTGNSGVVYVRLPVRPGVAVTAATISNVDQIRLDAGESFDASAFTAHEFAYIGSNPSDTLEFIAGIQ